MNQRLAAALLGVVFWTLSGFWVAPLWALHVDPALSALAIATGGACPAECDLPYPGMDEESGCVLCHCGGDTDPVTIEPQAGEVCRFELDRLGDETPPLDISLEDLCLEERDCVHALLTCLETHCQLSAGYMEIRDFGQNIPFIPAGYDVQAEIDQAAYSLARYDEDGSELFEIVCTEGHVAYDFPWGESVRVGLATDDCPDCIEAVLVDLSAETITPLGGEAEDGDTEEDEADPDETDEDPTVPDQTPGGGSSDPWISDDLGEGGGDEDREQEGITICRRECRCNQPMTTGFAWWLVLASGLLGLWLSRRRVEP